MKSFEIAVQESELGGWIATQLGDTFSVEARTAGEAVEGLIGFLNYWAESDE